MHVNFILPDVVKKETAKIGGFMFVNGVCRLPVQHQAAAERILCRYYGCTMEADISEPKPRAKRKPRRKTARRKAAPKATPQAEEPTGD